MSNLEGKYVIVRSDRAGVFAGVFKERNDQEVELTDCRRLWYWEGAASLSQIAVDGTTKPSKCKFSMAVNEILLFDVIEIIPATEKAERVIREVPVWKM